MSATYLGIGLGEGSWQFEVASAVARHLGAEDAAVPRLEEELRDLGRLAWLGLGLGLGLGVGLGLGGAAGSGSTYRSRSRPRARAPAQR